MKIYSPRDLAQQKNLPKFFQPYIYIGEEFEPYTIGGTYYPVEANYHWEQRIGFVVYVTHDYDTDYPYRMPDSILEFDVDYCAAFTIDQFYKSFWEA